MKCLPEILLCAVQGDDEVYSLTFTTDGITALNLTGATIKFVVVPSKDSPDADAIITKTITTIPLPLLGKVNLELTNTETNQAIGQYFYRLKLINASAKVKTIMKGTFKVDWAK